MIWLEPLIRSYINLVTSNFRERFSASCSFLSRYPFGMFTWKKFWSTVFTICNRQKLESVYIEQVFTTQRSFGIWIWQVELHLRIRVSHLTNFESCQFWKVRNLDYLDLTVWWNTISSLTKLRKFTSFLPFSRSLMNSTLHSANGGKYIWPKQKLSICCRHQVWEVYAGFKPRFGWECILKMRTIGWQLENTFSNCGQSTRPLMVRYWQIINFLENAINLVPFEPT